MKITRVDGPRLTSTRKLPSVYPTKNHVLLKRRETMLTLMYTQLRNKRARGAEGSLVSRPLQGEEGGGGGGESRGRARLVTCIAIRRSLNTRRRM